MVSRPAPGHQEGTKMSGQRWVLRSSFGALAILAGGSSFAWGQGGRGPIDPAPARPCPSDGPRWPSRMRCGPIPLTAPYPIAATWRNGVVVLSGRVGTKVVHDAAVQLAIALGFPFRDDLVIDTAETLPRRDELDPVDDRIRGPDPQPVRVLLRLPPAPLRPPG